MGDVLQVYEATCSHTLDKTFVLKPRQLNYEIEDLDFEQILSDERAKLEKCKAKVGEKLKTVSLKTWRAHTMLTHPLKGLPDRLKNEFSTLRPTVSQAYCKLAEIVSSVPELTDSPYFPTSKPFKTLHLCEAPGSFVQAMADFLPEKRRENWTWRINSLNPYFEGNSLDRLIYDDSFMLPYSENLLFGPDNSGSIMNWTEDYFNYVLGDTGRFHLITSDGSFDNTDNPSEQETAVYPLIAQAWKITSKMLARNGHAVIKIFTFFGAEMRSFLYQFYSSFASVLLKKPACSKPGNSEVYLIGLHFRPPTEPLGQESEDFKYFICQAAQFFVARQTEMIEFNLATVGKLTQYDRLAILRTKQDIETDVSRRFFAFLQSTVLLPPVLRELALGTPWQLNAWKSAGQKPESYWAYVRAANFDSQPPQTISRSIEWFFDARALLLGGEDSHSLNSIIRHSAVVISQRVARFNPMEQFLRISSSLFADFRLLQFAREHGVEYHDMCKKNNKAAFRRLRMPFVYKSDSIYVDCPRMERAQWLELCHLVALGSIETRTLLPQSTIAVLMPRSNIDLHIRHVHLFLPFGSTLVLSRFAGSVVFFFSLFFSELRTDEHGIHFSGQIKPSPELAAWIRRVHSDIPCVYDLLQFVPTTFFTNPSVYDALFAYNNHSLRTAIDARRKQLGGDPKNLESQG